MTGQQLSVSGHRLTNSDTHRNLETPVLSRPDQLVVALLIRLTTNLSPPPRNPAYRK